MFGVAPPQTLYHTRAPVSSSPNISTNAWQPSPSTSRAPPTSPPLPPFRFTTTGPSTKAKSKKRPGTGDSSTPLMDDHRSDGFLAVDQSSVYMHYRHSLNSLKDIIDRVRPRETCRLHAVLTDSHRTTRSLLLSSTTISPGTATRLESSTTTSSAAPCLPHPTPPLSRPHCPTSSQSPRRRRRRSVAGLSHLVSRLHPSRPRSA